MSQLAREADISREWLYKHFAGRDDVVAAVANREAVRFIDDLAALPYDTDDLAVAVTDAFVFSIEFLRDHPVLERILAEERDVLDPASLRRSDSVLTVAVRAGAAYLATLGDVAPDRSIAVAEVLVRLALTIVAAPRGVLDLHDPLELRAFAAATIPPLLR
jgi:AcrR family transcriptional regulator